MTDLADDATDLADDEHSAGYEPGDLFAHLRAVREQALSGQTLDLAIAGYGGKLLVRYGTVERDQLGRVVATVASGGDIGETAELDLIVGACRDVLVSDRAGGETRPLDPDSPIRFDGGDDRLARLLGFEQPTSARLVARQVFMSDRYPLSMSGHFYRLLEWLQGLDADATAVMQGESRAAED